MKKEYIKNGIRFLGYFFLVAISLISIYVLIVRVVNKENDNIVQASQGGEYFKNINPRFVINFINGEYIRFETESSYRNPFESSKKNFLEEVIYKLGIKEKKSGIEISLLDVSYDEDMQGILGQKGIQVSPKEGLNKSFELISVGREFGAKENGASKDTVISKNIYKGVDLEYQVIEGKGLKEEIVLNEIPEYTKECNQGECSMPVNSFIFNIKLDEGLSIKRSIGGDFGYPKGAYYITDKDGNYVAHFLPEFAVDSLGYKSSNIVSNIFETDSGEYAYEIILDPEWLLDKERVFPIRIDPSIINDSDLEFQQGVYDRTGYSANLTIGINSDTQKSGTYTSSNIELNENTSLKSIFWQGYGEATGSGETPFSELGLIYKDDFNNTVSEKVRWGEGALYLKEGTSKMLNIKSGVSENISVEYWSYRRHLLNEDEVFSSNLGSLSLRDGKYIFKDINNTEYITDIPVKYNHWEYISLVFNINSSNLSIYVDEFEYSIESIPFNQSSLDILTFKGEGYIDSVHVYDRLLARNEILSNSQYGNIYLQLSRSNDGINWKEWNSESRYVPTTTPKEGYIDIPVEGINNYDYISLDFLSDEEKLIVLGNSKFGNGVNDGLISLKELEGTVQSPESIRYLDLQFIPNTIENSCLLSLGGLEMHVNDIGKVVVNVNGADFETTDMYELALRNHIAVLKTDTGMSKIFFNGNIYQTDIPFPLLTNTYSVGSGCINGLATFSGDIENVRVSLDTVNDEEILKYANISDRSYTLKPVFIASLQSDSQITDIQDTRFSISEMDFGAVNHIVNLNIGDTIVIKEGEYTVQGSVLSLDPDTGQVEVDKWKEGSTVPSEGFTKLAKVLKWQTEYIPIKGYIDTINIQNYLNIAYTGVDIENIVFYKKIDPNGGITFDAEDKYLKYRLIYTASKYGLSPYISSITIDYEEGGPSMDQVMRHGQWFNNGEKQGFWWSN